MLQDIMTRLWYIYGSLEVHRASDSLREDTNLFESLFPGSVHLKAQHALCEYHLRGERSLLDARRCQGKVANAASHTDFDLAESHFDELCAQDPFRLDELDTYSNILYVMGKAGKLAQIAQKYAAIDPNRPEVCCLIGEYPGTNTIRISLTQLSRAGNLYSLRGDHAKAIEMFRQALRLDRGYLTAWTLMGHEYVEMSNTHAAIESYRKACRESAFVLGYKPLLTMGIPTEANRKDYRAWYGLGQAYELLSMPSYALQYFQKATALRYI